MKNSLEYAKKVGVDPHHLKGSFVAHATQAAEFVKDNPVFMFNVAFVQSELVTQILQLNENQRSVAGMEAAAKELDEAVQ